MNDYVFWYSETNTYKAGFTAENREEAERLLTSVANGELYHLEDLPEFWSKQKGSEWNVAESIDTLLEFVNE